MAKKDPPTCPNGPDAALARIGISIEPLPGGSGGRFAVKGDTYPHRQVLQDLGGQWHKLERHWVFEV